MKSPSTADLDYAVDLVIQVCAAAGDPSLISSDAKDPDLIRAIRCRDTPAIFEWLVEQFSYQGVSDAAARGFMEANGKITWEEVSAVFSAAQCPLLKSFWSFERCGFRKLHHRCNQRSHLKECGLPGLPMRNGRLGQMACSLYLFIRDAAEGDFVGWVRNRLEDNKRGPSAGNLLIEPLRHVIGVSDKVLNMVLSTFLLHGATVFPSWRRYGTGFVAIDSLVHNFLQRAGILKRFNLPHLYGPICHQDRGCVGAVHRIANRIDARQFNPDFPKHFPRFVQHALWRFCAQEALSVCNGMNIDDDRRCRYSGCSLYSRCDRYRLKTV